MRSTTPYSENSTWKIDIFQASFNILLFYIRAKGAGTALIYKVQKAIDQCQCHLYTGVLFLLRVLSKRLI